MTTVSQLQMELLEVRSANEKLTDKVKDFEVMTRPSNQAASYEAMLDIEDKQLQAKVAMYEEEEEGSLALIDKKLHLSNHLEKVQKAVRVLNIFKVHTEVLFTQAGYESTKDWWTQEHCNGKCEGSAFYEYQYATQFIPAISRFFPDRQPIGLIHHNAVSFINQPTSVSNELREHPDEYAYLRTGQYRNNKPLMKQIPTILLEVLDVEKVRDYLREDFTEETYRSEVAKLWQVITSDIDYNGNITTNLNRFHALCALYKNIYRTKLEEEEAQAKKAEEDMMKEAKQAVYLGADYTHNGHAIIIISTKNDAKAMELLTAGGFHIVTPSGVKDAIEGLDMDTIHAIGASLSGGYTQE